MRRRSSSRSGGVSRPLVAAALLIGLAACAPDAGDPAAEDMQRVEVEGRIIEFMASGSMSDAQYLLDVSGQGFLSISIPNPPPPMGVRGVVVEVPADAEIPSEVAGEYAALNAIVEGTGEPLPVVDYLR